MKMDWFLNLLMTKKDKIIAVVSLAASAIIHTETNYMELLPSTKVDVFAIDKSYQKLHYDNESETAIDRENHYYFSEFYTFICK